MIGESTLNEYKVYKSIMKHKKIVNRVFSELGTEIALRSRPLGMEKKIPAVAVVVCSAAPPKALRRRASKKEKAKSSAGDTSSSVVRLGKTKSLESSKRKRKASEVTSNAEIQAASSLAQLGWKKSKKAVKKVVAVVVQRVPPAFSDDEVIEEPRQTSLFSCLCCELRFGG
jgi:hypothetical protein